MKIPDTVDPIHTSFITIYDGKHGVTNYIELTI